MIRNFLFDMGRVLIQYDPQKFVNRLEINEEDTALLKDLVFGSQEWLDMDAGILTMEEGIASIKRKAPERLHGQVDQLVWHWDEPLDEIPGMFEIVKAIKEKGYKLYLVSNAATHQHDYWPRISCSQFFDGTVISADIKMVKPGEEIFQYTYQKFGLQAEECYFVDDHMPNIETGRRLGMTCFQFMGSSEELKKDLVERGLL